MSIQILYEIPAILTKDTSWECNTPLEAGAIIYLPQDAVLVYPPPKVEELQEGIPTSRRTPDPALTSPKKAL